jgi:pimeloyl-ACP methyl ester carboxylesterase
MNNEYVPFVPAEYIVPLNMNGLKGRLLRLPPPKRKKREMLVLYGHHSTLERWYALAQVINEYGGVTMPDLPGFGGMDSFYKIGEKPDLDTMADYLASVIKLRYKGRRFTIIGLSYGFIVVTRMLQRYPEIAKKVDMLLSVVGFAHHDDFTFSRTRRFSYLLGAGIFTRRLTGAFFHSIILSPLILRTFYSRTHNAKNKFIGLTVAEKRALTEFEIHLWRINEVRTYMTTSISMLTLNNCKQQVDLPVWHVAVKKDYYFDNRMVEQHMRIIFTDFTMAEANLEGHTPTIISGKSETSKFLPKKFCDLLRKNP